MLTADSWKVEKVSEDPGEVAFEPWLRCEATERLQRPEPFLCGFRASPATGSKDNFVPRPMKNYILKPPWVSTDARDEGFRFFFNFMDLHCNVGNVNREESDSSTRPPSSGFHIANPCETSLTQWRMSWNGWKMGVLIRRPFAFCITAVLLTVRLKLPFLCSDSVTPFAVSHPAGRDLITATSGFSDVVHITFARGLWGWRFGPLPFWNLRSRGTCNDPGLRTLLHCDWNGWRTWRTQWIPIRTRVASLQLQGWREDSSDGADV